MVNFKITQNKGFQITFENDWTISVQFGYGNYCDNYKNDKFRANNTEMIVDSTDAEIAIWNGNGDWYVFDNGDTVKRYCSPDEVAEWINKVIKF